MHEHIDLARIYADFGPIGVSRSGGRLSMHASGTAVDVNAPVTVSRVQAIQNRLAELEAELAELARFGSDDYEEGAVLTFKGDYNGPKTYAYAAIKAGGKWHLTGGKAVQHATWDQLVEFMRKANVRKVKLVTETSRVV